jgi:hypothetical protein
MRKSTILLAVLFAVAATSAADAAKKKAEPAKKADPAVAAQENSLKFVRAAWQPWKTTTAAPAKPKAKGKKKS